MGDVTWQTVQKQNKLAVRFLVESGIQVFNFLTMTVLFFSEGDADGDKKEKVEDVENAEPVAS